MSGTVVFTKTPPHRYNAAADGNGQEMEETNFEQKAFRTNADPNSSRGENSTGVTRGELDEISLTSKRMIIAGGFLDIALFSTNCEQLKFAVESQHLTSPGRFKFVLTMLAVSLTLQALMAILFFFASFLTETGSIRQRLRRQHFFNNTVMLMVALVTLVNIVISTFSNKSEITKYCMNMKRELDGNEYEKLGNFSRYSNEYSYY